MDEEYETLRKKNEQNRKGLESHDKNLDRIMKKYRLRSSKKGKSSKKSKPRAPKGSILDEIDARIDNFQEKVKNPKSRKKVEKEIGTVIDGDYEESYNLMKELRAELRQKTLKKLISRHSGNPNFDSEKLANLDNNVGYQDLGGKFDYMERSRGPQSVQKPNFEKKKLGVKIDEKIEFETRESIEEETERSQHGQERLKSGRDGENEGENFSRKKVTKNFLERLKESKTGLRAASPKLAALKNQYYTKKFHDDENSDQTQKSSKTPKNEVSGPSLTPRELARSSKRSDHPPTGLKFPRNQLHQMESVESQNTPRNLPEDQNSTSYARSWSNPAPAIPKKSFAKKSSKNPKKGQKGQKTANKGAITHVMLSRAVGEDLRSRQVDWDRELLGEDEVTPNHGRGGGSGELHRPTKSRISFISKLEEGSIMSYSVEDKGSFRPEEVDGSRLGSNLGRKVVRKPSKPPIGNNGEKRFLGGSKASEADRHGLKDDLGITKVDLRAGDSQLLNKIRELKLKRDGLHDEITKLLSRISPY